MTSPAEFSFARLSSEHVAELADLDEETNPHPWTGKQWLDSLTQHECFGIWRNAAQTHSSPHSQPRALLGFVVCMATLDEAEILLIAITPQYQRGGLGGRLLAYAEKILQGEGVQQLFLEVRASNQPARTFYAHHGWREAGVRKNYYRGTDSEREDAIICSKTLLSECQT